MDWMAAVISALLVPIITYLVARIVCVAYFRSKLDFIEQIDQKLNKDKE
jgi:hypothetical protein